eukprot:Hpha_TRINITY_DN9779_c0_g1::TRINITY_DN9779_c0_g1_i2::g.10217::m.10217
MSPLCKLVGRREGAVATVALHRAARRGDAGAVAPLVELGAKVWERGGDGIPPLHRAAGVGAEECVSELLRMGARALGRDERGLLACEVAANGRHHSTVRCLGNAGHLPARLRELYSPLRTLYCVKLLLLSVTLLFLVIAGMTMEVARTTAVPEPASDNFEFVGAGDCRTEYSIKPPSRIIPVRMRVEECARAAESEGAYGFLYDPTGSQNCELYTGVQNESVIQELAGGQAGFYSAVPGSLLTRYAHPTVAADYKQCYAVRGSRHSDHIFYSYTMLSPNPYGTCSTNGTECGYTLAEASPRSDSFQPCVDSVSSCSRINIMLSCEDTTEDYVTDCPASCAACPGSIVAEHRTRGGSLLNDGKTNTNGEGCVSLGDGVVLMFTGLRDVRKVVLDVYGDTAPLFLVSKPYNRSLSSLLSSPLSEARRRGSEWVVDLEEGCSDGVYLRTPSRVCEVRLEGREDCGTFGLIKRFHSCLGQDVQEVNSPDLCLMAAGEWKHASAGSWRHLLNATEAEWAMEGICESRRPMAQPTNWSVPERVCMKSNSPSRKRLDVASGYCNFQRGTLLSFTTAAFNAPIAIEDCKEILLKYSHPLFAMQATWIRAKPIEALEKHPTGPYIAHSTMCLLHVDYTQVELIDHRHIGAWRVFNGYISTYGVRPWGGVEAPFENVSRMHYKGFENGAMVYTYNQSLELDADIYCYDACIRNQWCTAAMADDFAYECLFVVNGTGYDTGSSRYWRWVPERNVARLNYISSCLTVELEPPPPDDPEYRLSFNVSCPVGTAIVESQADCSRAGYELRFPRMEAVRSEAHDTPPGCWYGTRLTFNDEQSLFMSYDTLTAVQLCKRVPPFSVSLRLYYQQSSPQQCFAESVLRSWRGAGKNALRAQAY